jgi:hypothetical protein
MNQINLNGVWRSPDGHIQIDFDGITYQILYYGVPYSGTFIQVHDEEKNQMDINLSNAPFGLSVYQKLDENDIRFEFRHELKREVQNGN